MYLWHFLDTLTFIFFVNNLANWCYNIGDDYLRPFQVWGPCISEGRKIRSQRGGQEEDMVECVPFSKRCDGLKDCSNGLDEESCDTLVALASNTLPLDVSDTEARSLDTATSPIPICSPSYLLCLVRNNTSHQIKFRRLLDTKTQTP